jgi:hypothetical protein
VGLLGIAFKVVAALVLIFVGLAAFLYFTDYEAKATISETGRDEGGAFAVVTPRIAPWIDHKQALDDQSAQFVCKGYEVSFRLQTRALKVYDREGDLVYDNQRAQPLSPSVDLVRCGALGL